MRILSTAAFLAFFGIAMTSLTVLNGPVAAALAQA